IAVKLHRENAWLFNIYGLAQISFLVWAGMIFISVQRYKNIIRLLFFCILVVWIWSVLNGNLNIFFNWFFVLSAILIVFVYGIVLIDKTVFKTQRIFAQPLFLVCISFIIYFGSPIPVLGVLNTMVSDNIAIARGLFSINKIAGIVCYSLIAIAFYLYGQQARRGYVHQ